MEPIRLHRFLYSLHERRLIAREGEPKGKETEPKVGPLMTEKEEAEFRRQYAERPLEEFANLRERVEFNEILGRRIKDGRTPKEKAASMWDIYQKLGPSFLETLRLEEEFEQIIRRRLEGKSRYTLTPAEAEKLRGTYALAPHDVLDMFRGEELLEKVIADHKIDETAASNMRHVLYGRPSRFAYAQRMEAIYYVEQRIRDGKANGTMTDAQAEGMRQIVNERGKSFADVLKAEETFENIIKTRRVTKKLTPEQEKGMRDVLAKLGGLDVEPLEKFLDARILPRIGTTWYIPPSAIEKKNYTPDQWKMIGFVRKLQVEDEVEELIGKARTMESPVPEKKTK